MVVVLPAFEWLNTCWQNYNACSQSHAIRRCSVFCKWGCFVHPASNMSSSTTVFRPFPLSPTTRNSWITWILGLPHVKCLPCYWAVNPFLPLSTMTKRGCVNSTLFWNNTKNYRLRMHNSSHSEGWYFMSGTTKWPPSQSQPEKGPTGYDQITTK